MAHDVVNPRTLELEVAKEILSELFDIRTNEVDEMIRQRIVDRHLLEINPNRSVYAGLFEMLISSDMI